MRRVGVAAIIAATAAGLAGCAAGPQATITITYESDQGQQTVTAHPTTIRCSASRASAHTLDDRPFSAANIHFENDQPGRWGSAWIGGDQTVSFDATTLDISRSGQDVTATAEGGTVTVIDRDLNAGESPDPDSPDATTTTGNVRIQLTCPH